MIVWLKELIDRIRYPMRVVEPDLRDEWAQSGGEAFEYARPDAMIESEPEPVWVIMLAKIIIAGALKRERNGESLTVEQQTYLRLFREDGDSFGESFYAFFHDNNKGQPPQIIEKYCHDPSENWMDTCLQLIASGEITQESLYVKLSVIQKIDLEAYVERKSNN